MKFLITVNHEFYTKFLVGKIIILITYDNNHYEILIDGERKIYTNRDYDIAIIELKDKDKIDESSFFEIDNRIFENPNDFITNEQVILLYYSGEYKIPLLSAGIMTMMSHNDYEIYQICNIGKGDGWGPIINLINYKVIGFHYGLDRNFNFNILF